MSQLKQLDFRPRIHGGAPFMRRSQNKARRTKVLVIVPTLDLGGAEMDIARVLPRLDHSEFEFLVFTFLARGALAQSLAAAGIEVVGPFVASRPQWLVRLGPALRNFIAAVAPRILRHAARRYWPTWRSRLSRLAAFTISSGKYLADHLPAPVSRLFHDASAWSTYVVIGFGLAHFIRARDVDIIHTVLPNSYVIGSVANLLFNRRPLIMSRLSLNWYQRRDRLYYFVERQLLHAKVQAVVSNCQEILRELRDEGIPETKLRLIQNGIDIADFSSRMIGRDAARQRLGLADSGIVISVIANLHKYKGHADVLRALHHVRDQMPEWTLVVIGRDINGNRARLETLCGELGLAQRVRFLGERGDIPVILSAADIHVSGSHTEGLPNNIIEAMCARLPIVATAVGGTGELLVDREMGLLVQPRDPIAMGQALLQLAHDGPLRRQLGEAGYKHVIHFSIDRSAAAFDRLYAEIAASRRRADKQT